VLRKIAIVPAILITLCAITDSIIIYYRATELERRFRKDMARMQAASSGNGAVPAGLVESHQGR